MRLLRIESLTFEQYSNYHPKYIILSHTWGDEEVTHQELQKGSAHGKKGLAKIVGFCNLVRRQRPDIHHVWVDTCCIDKTSSAELTETLNAMFQWYRDAECCYAFLEDVALNSQTKRLGQDFDDCRWFTRGWTLQELLAPANVEFYDQSWTPIGTKATLTARIANVTRIQEPVLQTGNVSGISVACKMSWAAARQTTRVEDMAYSLMGIFDINMPMLYGEGNRAFLRLQEEIIRRYDDQSILAWDATNVPEDVAYVGALAPHPSTFRNCAGIRGYPNMSDEPMTITNQGINVDLDLFGQGKWDSRTLSMTTTLAALNCSQDGDFTTVIQIPVQKCGFKKGMYSRTRESFQVQNLLPTYMQRSTSSTAERVKMLVAHNKQYMISNLISQCWLQYESSHLKSIAAFPRDEWVHSKMTSALTWTFPPLPTAPTGDDEKTVSATLVFRLNQQGCDFAIRLNVDPLDGTNWMRIVQLPDGLDVETLTEEALLTCVMSIGEDQQGHASGKVASKMVSAQFV